MGEKRRSPSHKDTSNDNSSIEFLVVEYNYGLRNRIAELLRARGYKVAEAASAEQALEVLSQRQFGAMVAAEGLAPGGMTGRQLAEVIKQKWPDLPYLIHFYPYAMSVIHHPSPEKMLLGDIQRLFLGEQSDSGGRGSGGRAGSPLVRLFVETQAVYLGNDKRPYNLFFWQGEHLKDNFKHIFFRQEIGAQDDNTRGVPGWVAQDVAKVQVTGNQDSLFSAGKGKYFFISKGTFRDIPYIYDIITFIFEIKEEKAGNIRIQNYLHDGIEVSGSSSSLASKAANTSAALISSSVRGGYSALISSGVIPRERASKITYIGVRVPFMQGLPCWISGSVTTRSKRLPFFIISGPPIAGYTTISGLESQGEFRVFNIPAKDDDEYNDNGGRSPVLLRADPGGTKSPSHKDTRNDNGGKNVGGSSPLGQGNGRSSVDNNLRYDFLSGDGIIDSEPRDSQARVESLSRNDRMCFRLKNLAIRTYLLGFLYLGVGLLCSLWFECVNPAFVGMASLIYYISSLLWAMMLSDLKYSPTSIFAINRRIVFYRSLQFLEIILLPFAVFNLASVFTFRPSSYIEIITPPSLLPIAVVATIIICVLFTMMTINPKSGVVFMCTHYAIRGVWHKSYKGRWGGVFGRAIKSLCLKKKVFFSNSPEFLNGPHATTSPKGNKRASSPLGQDNGGKNEGGSSPVQSEEEEAIEKLIKEGIINPDIFVKGSLEYEGLFNMLYRALYLSGTVQFVKTIQKHSRDYNVEDLVKEVCFFLGKLIRDFGEEPVDLLFKALSYTMMQYHTLSSLVVLIPWDEGALRGFVKDLRGGTSLLIGTSYFIIAGYTAGEKR